MNLEEARKKFERRFRQLFTNALFEGLSNRHPVTGEQMTMEEGKNYFNKSVDEALVFFDQLLKDQVKEVKERMREEIIGKNEGVCDYEGFELMPSEGKRFIRDKIEGRNQLRAKQRIKLSGQKYGGGE